MMKRMAMMLVVAGMAGLSAGCFGLLGGGPEYAATVVVRNDVEPPAALTIVLTQNGDDRATLGTVEAGRERTLRYTSGEIQGSYQLVARQTSGAGVTSRTFTLFDGARVRWDVRENSLSVSQR